MENIGLKIKYFLIGFLLAVGIMAAYYRIQYINLYAEAAKDQKETKMQIEQLDYRKMVTLERTLSIYLKEMKSYYRAIDVFDKPEEE